MRRPMHSPLIESSVQSLPLPTDRTDSVTLPPTIQVLAAKPFTLKPRPIPCLRQGLTHNANSPATAIGTHN